LDEVFKESSLVVGCKMTKNVDGMDVNVGWLVTLLRKTKKNPINRILINVNGDID
jgi:hypothetical protein